MELIIGGRAQGKLAYGKSLYPDGILWNSSVTEDNFKSIGEQTIIWNQFHSYVREQLKEGKTKEEIWNQVEKLQNACKRLLIISDEIGNGIVPMEKEERLWREETGRLLCRIAAEAERVVRVVCGIPCQIK